MANGTLKVSNIQTSSGSGTITLGQSGETISVPSGATIPSEADVNVKIQELKDEETQRINDKASADAKLKALGLTDDEIEAFRS